MKRRKAVAVVAKPPGTLTPSADSSRIISPREAFLPPTSAMASIPTCAKGTTSRSAAVLVIAGGLLG